ncbi:uncharacterized protein LOC143046822 [Mytilus galloprovincialis]|uniref:uncharacterized protein LOC143046822 n=1 Tax=Mytilus galloprovincialis TaxID=29158 RepID=UPI003F7BECF1
MNSSICVCLTHKPALNDDINDCRIECDNAIYTPCSSGRSSLVFTFVEDVIIQPTTTYIEKECVTTTKDKNKFIVSDCNAPYIFGCKNTSIQLTAKSWYEYQELCLKDGSSVLFNRNTIGNHASEKPLWTPIFRSHIVVTGKLSVNDSCVAVSKVGTNNLTVENCASQFPFLCLGKQKKNTIYCSTSNNRYPRFINLPLFVVVAVSLLVIILILSMVIISFTAFKKIRILQEKLKKVNERLPGTEFSTYTGIEDTTEQVNDSAYKELSANVSQQGRNCNERKMDTSEDTLDYQGYLVPEQHYQTIPELEVHYAAANMHVAEGNLNKDKLDEDDYLEPVI